MIFEGLGLQHGTGSNFNLLLLRIATRHGKNVTGHTVGQGSTFKLQIYYYCGVILLTADILLFSESHIS